MLRNWIWYKKYLQSWAGNYIRFTYKCQWTCTGWYSYFINRAYWHETDIIILIILQQEIIQLSNYMSSRHQHLITKQNNDYCNSWNRAAINDDLILKKISYHTRDWTNDFYRASEMSIPNHQLTILYYWQVGCPSQIINRHFYIILFSWPIGRTILNYHDTRC